VCLVDFQCHYVALMPQDESTKVRTVFDASVTLIQAEGYLADYEVRSVFGFFLRLNLCLVTLHSQPQHLNVKENDR
jgi:hypothetical protein